MKKIIAVFVIIILAYGIYRLTKLPASPAQPQDFFKKPEEVKNTMATLIPEKQADFSKDGNLRLKIGEETEGQWMFIYDEPGKMAANVLLDFNNRSICDYGNGEQICNTKKFEIGQRVHVEGNINGDLLTVLKLKILNE